MKLRSYRGRLALGAVALVAVVPAAASASTDTTEGEATATTAATDDSSADTASDGTAAATAGGGTLAAAECDEPDAITLQLQWVTQGQFAGYFAAKDLGFYENQCLDVTIAEGAVDIVPQQQLADGAADFAIAWVPKALATREAGADIVNIAQVFQRSGTLQVSFTDTGITSVADFAGKTIGNWGFGNEYEIFAALAENDLDPASDVELVAQQFDMNALLAGDIDAAEAMTYNEYAMVLEAVNPDTGEQYTADDLNVISYEDEGVGMLQDAIWADESRLADEPEYRDAAVRFVAASLEGWAYCRDNPQECADIVLDNSPILGESHQLWMTNEVNKLIWPADGGVGTIDEDAWNRTVEIAKATPNLDGATVLTADPTDGAWTNDIVTEAQALLTEAGIDINGADYEPVEVTLNEGGA